MAVRELVENSFPYEEPILVREDGKIRVTSIGDFVESELRAGPDVCVDDRYYMHLKKSVEILTLDEKMRLAFRPLTAVFKHRSPEELWKITMHSGRTVTTTSSHNVFVLDESMSVVGKKTSDLRIGDRVVIPSSSTLETNLDEIEVAQELLKLPANVTSRIVVHGLAAQYSPSPTRTQALLAVVGGSVVSRWELREIAAKAGFDEPTKTIPDLRRNGYLERVGPATYRRSASRKPKPQLGVDRNWVKTDSVPLNFFRDDPPQSLNESALSFSVKQGRRRIPSRIPITRELMRVLGYFASEGSIHANHKISFSFGSHELGTNVKDLITCLESVFNLKPIVTLERKAAVNVVLNDASLAFLFERILGTGSRSCDKRVSWVVFGSSREMVDEFLGAYIRGNGHVQSAKRNRKITLATSSHGLFTDLKFLLVLSGKHFTTAASEGEDRTVNGVPTRFAKSFYVYIRQGLAPETDSVRIGNLRGELRRIVRNKSNIYRLTVQKKWLRQNISGDSLPPALGKFVFSDAGSLPVKKIERVLSQSAWVYDVSVKGVERFIGGQAVALLHNSLDAAELAGILPDVYVRIVPDDPSAENANQEPKAYRITVADNGPGVDPHHVPRAFGKVFYGSKYVLRQSRGMFGMGGTMAILYGQITTNKPVKVTVSTEGKSRHIFEMLIDIAENKPIILRKDVEDGAGKTGTRVDVVLEGDFTRAAQKINEYFKQTALVCSYANLTFVDPIGRITTFERATESMPQPPKETLPHPHGVDVEALKRMIKLTEEKSMVKFMGNKHFHRVGETNAKKFLNFAGIDSKISPEKLSNEQIVKVVDALQRYPEFLPPDASCLSPVGEQILQTGIIKELQPEFSTVVARPPSSYSGFPFLVEVGLVYGGKLLEPGRKLFRFANRIPLLYDESSDVSFKVLNEEIDWRRYHVPEDAPIAVITHICLPSSEKVLASIDGELRYCAIGDLIDTEIQLSTNKQVDDGVTCVVPRRKILVASVNPDTYKVEYVPVKRLMRREGGPVLRITAEEGRAVLVSPEHPLLVVTPNGILSKRAVEIVSGDYLVGARKIPIPPTDLAQERQIDLMESFARARLADDIVVVGAKKLLYRETQAKIARALDVRTHTVENWRRHDRMPLSAYLQLETDKEVRSQVGLLGRRSHGVPIPALIRIDNDLARLIGFYLSEGCGHTRNSYVSFSFDRDEAVFQTQVIEALCRVFNISPTVDRKKKDKTVQITSYNKALALLFSIAWRAGKNSDTKAVPDFVFSTPKVFIANVLDSYFAGDGYYYPPTRHVQASSSSAELIQGLFVLSRMVGLEVSVNKFGKYSRLDTLGGRNYSEVRKLLQTVITKKDSAAESAIIEYRPSSAHKIPVFVFSREGKLPLAPRKHVGGGLSSDSRISDKVAVQLGLLDGSSDKFVTGDIQCLRVRRVEVLDYEGSYYNIETTATTLPNYMHGYGIFSHNCSTKVPYKTVGKEYIADRPEIETEIRNAVREALRRLSLFLSKKGSMEAVQRKMSIYGRYLPLIARFSTELAGQKREPRYHQLIKDEEAEVEEVKEEISEKSGSREEEKGERPIEQTTIEDYR